MKKIFKVDIVISLSAIILLAISLIFIGTYDPEAMWINHSTQTIKNGYYQMTEKSWQKVLDNWVDIEDAAPSRTKVIIYEDNLFRIENMSIQLFKISLSGDHYTAKNESEEYEFKLNGDILTLESQDHEKNYQLRYYPNVKFATDEPQAKLMPLSYPEIKIDGVRSYIKWKYNGKGWSPLFATVEVKQAGSETYKERAQLQVELTMNNSYFLQFGVLQLTTGENIVRIAHKGGPRIDTDSNTIHFVETSDWFYFKIVKSESGELSIEFKEK